jgi:enamine deaminase RidA (YjgF/YER057c/UK114 family)
MLKKVPRGLIFTGLDVLESDAAQSATALQDFDRRLPGLLEQLRPGDLLVLTGDHGRDITKADQVSTREYVPILASGPKLAQGVNLGIRASAADLGHTIVDALQGDQLPVGESFLDALRAGWLMSIRTSYESRLAQLQIKLPPPPQPLATYVPAVRAGDLLFLSGVLPMRDGQLAFSGKLGRDLTVEQGVEAARLALLNALAIAKQELGTLDRITRVVKVVGHVASVEGFVQQPQVLNGASDLLVEIFGEAGRHARVAVGAAELPRGAPVEIEVILSVSW